MQAFLAIIAQSHFFKVLGTQERAGDALHHVETVSARGEGKRLGFRVLGSRGLGFRVCP